MRSFNRFMVLTAFPTLDGSSIRFAIGLIGGGYTGKLSADRASISGMWTQGRPLPLEFKRASKKAAWLDPSPHRAQFMAVENNVKLEVLDGGGSARHWFCWQVLETRSTSASFVKNR